MEVYRGKIKAFHGSWMSGIGHLVIENEDGVVMDVPCENAPTVRALEGAFGNVIGPGHSVLPPEEAGYYDREVYWSFDELGLIFEGFTPVEEATPGLISIYEAERSGV